MTTKQLAQMQKIARNGGNSAQRRKFRRYMESTILPMVYERKTVSEIVAQTVCTYRQVKHFLWQWGYSQETIMTKREE